MAQYTEMSYEQNAKDIIASNNYFVLSTCNKNNTPWAAAILFVNDKDHNFYFMSAVDSRHAKNIIENPNIAGVIFDSKQPVGSSLSVQFEGTAKIVDTKEEIVDTIKLYSKKAFPGSKFSPDPQFDPGNYSGAAEFKFFKIEPKKIYITVAGGVEEVNLKAIND